MTPLPTFLLLGAARAGTTSLHRWFAGHPDVCMSRPKETQFFSLDYDRGPAYYARYFAHHTGEAAIGESTPVYLTLPHVPQRIAQLLPDVVLLAVLRDPVAQAHSTWWKIRSLGAERRSFADAVAAELRDGPAEAGEEFWARFLAASQQGRQVEDGGYLLAGHYAAAVRRYRRHFAASQLTVVFHDELAADPAGVTAQLARAVGIDPARAPAPAPERRNAGVGPAEAWVRRRTARVPSARVRRAAATAARRLAPARPPALDAGLAHDLRRYFAAANSDLERLLGRAVPSGWWTSYARQG